MVTLKYRDDVGDLVGEISQIASVANATSQRHHLVAFHLAVPTSSGFATTDGKEAAVFASPPVYPPSFWRKADEAI